MSRTYSYARHTLWFRGQQKQWELTTKTYKSDWMWLFLFFLFFFLRNYIFILSWLLCRFVGFYFLFWHHSYFKRKGGNLIFYNKLTAQAPEREAKWWPGTHSKVWGLHCPVCCNVAVLNPQSIGQCTRAETAGKCGLEITMEKGWVLFQPTR